MEELQDAIEDAQYVSAISSVIDGPRPVLPWEIPEEEQLASWKAKVIEKHTKALEAARKAEKKGEAGEKKEEEEENSNGKGKGKDNGKGNGKGRTIRPGRQKESAQKREKLERSVPFEFEWTLSHALGLFLFSAYVKDVAGAHVDINFMEEVVRWKGMRGRFRAEKTSLIVTNYLGPLPEGYTPPPESDDDEGSGSGSDSGGSPGPAATPGGDDSPKEGGMANEEEEKEKEKGGGEAAATTTENGGEKSGETGETGEGGATAAAAAAPPPPPKKKEKFGPKKTEIVEYDLARESSPDISPENVAELRSQNDDPTKNCVGVGGRVLDTILSRVEKLRTSPGYTTLILPNIAEDKDEMSEDEEDDQRDPFNAMPLPSPPKRLSEREKEEAAAKQRSLRHLSLVSNELPNGLFDEAEAIVADRIRERHWKGFKRSEQQKKLLNFLWFQDRTVVEEDFFVMRVLGRGGFGLVTACKKGTSGKLYAMKVMNKKRIKIKKAEQLTLNEQKCLADVNSPFVVNLKYSLQSPTDVFLILDLMTGGDLSYHLSQRGRFPKEECLYYGARIMLGLQALHDRGYVYRDLKPENCLFGEDGRVKLTDLGLATQVTPNLHGAAGTRGYWAPEMLRRDEKGKRKSYTHMVDWFSFGCCLAEFISGTNPFRSEVALNYGLEKGKKTKEKAIDCATMEMHPKFDSTKFSEEASDICRRLLDKSESTRLGARGCTEIMKHPWFREVKWEEIISDRARPPFIPPKDVNAASQSEIGTFGEDKAFHETVLNDKDAAVYNQWNFTNEKAFAAEVIEFLIYERETGEPLLPVEPGTSCCCVII